MSTPNGIFAGVSNAPVYSRPLLVNAVVSSFLESSTGLLLSTIVPSIDYFYEISMSTPFYVVIPKVCRSRLLAIWVILCGYMVPLAPIVDRYRNYAPVSELSYLSKFAVPLMSGSTEISAMLSSRLLSVPLRSKMSSLISGVFSEPLRFYFCFLSNGVDIFLRLPTLFGTRF